MCRAASAWRRKPPVNGFGSTTAIGHEPDLTAMRARDIAGYRNAGRTLSVAFAFEPFAKPQAQCLRNGVSCLALGLLLVAAPSNANGKTRLQTALAQATVPPSGVLETPRLAPSAAPPSGVLAHSQPLERRPVTSAYQDGAAIKHY